MILAKASDFCVGQLASGITATQTTVTLKAGDGGWFPTFSDGEWLDAVLVSKTDPDDIVLADFRAGEKVRIVGRSGDTITLAARNGSAWYTNNVLMGVWSAAMIERLVWKLHDLELALWSDRGRKNGVFRYGSDWATQCLCVMETSPASMAVLVQPGVCMVDGHVYCLREAAATDTVSAPLSLNRIDLVQAVVGSDGDIDGVSIKEGTEAATPVAPDPDTNCLGLFEVLLTPSHSSIANTDLTDKRVWL